MRKYEKIMEKNEEQLIGSLSDQELRTVNGGYYPPTEEQLETVTGGNSILKDIICWNSKQ